MRKSVPGAGARCLPPIPATEVVSTTGVAVAVAVTVAVASLGVVVGSTKGVVAVNVEASPTVPPLIRRAPCAEAVQLYSVAPGDLLPP